MEKRRVAVVGSGVAGISAAYHLRKHGPENLEVVLLEANPEKIGGHANTIAGGTSNMPYSCDAGFYFPEFLFFKITCQDSIVSGFMVCNHDTYPNLLQFFADLQVKPPTLSFFTLASLLVVVGR